MFSNSRRAPWMDRGTASALLLVAAALLTAGLLGCAGASPRSSASSGTYRAERVPSPDPQPAPTSRAERVPIPDPALNPPVAGDGAVTLGKAYSSPPDNVLAPRSATEIAPPPALNSEGDGVPPGTLPAAPQPERMLEGPRFSRDDGRGAGIVELLVQSPARIQAGSPVTFDVTVRNGTPAAVDEVAVESEFDAVFTFPGSGEKHVRQSLGRLEPGAERTLALTLTTDSPGTACNRFSVRSRGQEVVWKSVCVEVMPREAELRLLGPKVRTIGSRAEFTAKLVNSSSKAWTQVEARVAHPAALVPREASTGARQSPGKLSWNLDRVEPGEGVQIQVEFECTAAVTQGCLTFQVTSAGMEDRQTEACLDVVTAAGPLRLEVGDGVDPLGVGEETEYVVSVRNTSSRAVPAVGLNAEIPGILQVVSANARIEPAGGSEPDVRVAGSDVVVSPLRDLAPDAVITLRIRVRALRPGDGEMMARVKSGGEGGTLLESAEPTSVNR